ncbi:hypothetical protein Pla123a_04970 [Posidoniimonas polymericola]|uniref:Uncharacterized protein n=1 Tax=Posidoniimonas polymericola TaxID=2528002 RepID=A0A5C5ZEX6_9BACT|nr:hypothetical protein [Posidoniimonas polymericola]TWT85690.1 hypothetical protein Pla123a_04970 [Posidoniimonas polymericola]
MNQIRSLTRDTWWLWAAVAVLTALQIHYISWFFLVNVPILLIVFVYFAFIRYDSNGNLRAQNP